MRNITTAEIEVAIANHFKPRTCIAIVPNISWGMGLHECDMFVVKRSGYATEIEIKKSKSDLIADLKKRHKHKSDIIRDLYFCIPKERVEDWKQYIPEHAGILAYYHINGLYNVPLLRVTEVRSPVSNRSAKRLSVEQQLTVARLGCLRIWSLKQKLNAKIKTK